jgi:hypothetical protein
MKLRQPFMNPLIWLLGMGALWLQSPGLQAQTNLLIMGEDEDAARSVARNTELFRNTLNTLNATLTSAGLAVWDETALTYEDSLQGLTNRGDEQLIDVARGIRKPRMQLLLIFSIRKNQVSDNMLASFEGRLLELQSGKLLGNDFVELKQSIPRRCDSACQDDLLESGSSELVTELGKRMAALAQGDTSQPRGDSRQAFTITFEQFSAAEMAAIESLLVKYPDYLSHEYTTVRNGFLSQVRYNSASSRSRLMSYLMQEFKNIALDIALAYSDDAFTFRNTTGQAQRQVGPQPRPEWDKQQDKGRSRKSR